MGEYDSKCCCACHSNHKESCSGEEKHEESTYYFFEVADAAWEEVLKDKMKEYILSTQNERMTELAKIVAEGNNHRWRNKMEKKHGCMDFKEKLGRFFGQFKK